MFTFLITKLVINDKYNQISYLNRKRPEGDRSLSCSLLYSVGHAVSARFARLYPIACGDKSGYLDLNLDALLGGQSCYRYITSAKEPVERIELPTFHLQGGCSTRLSYTGS